MRVENKEIQCLYLKNPPTLAKNVKNVLFETPSRANFTDIRRMFRFCN